MVSRVSGTDILKNILEKSPTHRFAPFSRRLPLSWKVPKTVSRTLGTGGGSVHRVSVACAALTVTIFCRVTFTVTRPDAREKETRVAPGETCDRKAMPLPTATANGISCRFLHEDRSFEVRVRFRVRSRTSCRGINLARHNCVRTALVSCVSSANRWETRATMLQGATLRRCWCLARITEGIFALISQVLSCPRESHVVHERSDGRFTGHRHKTLPRSPTRAW